MTIRHEKLPALEDRPCPLGCSQGDETLFVASDRLHGLPGMFAVVRCRSCRLIRTNPRPTEAGIAFYYPEDYQPHTTTRTMTGQEDAFQRIRRLLWPLARWLIQDEVLPPIPPGRMLEVGCATGAFLARMRERQWDVRGIEASPRAASAARHAGLDVHAGSIESAVPPDVPYDLIVMFMTLEHLHDPVASLRRLRGWVKPDGWLVASVPNAAALDFTLFRQHGFALQVPTHLFHFTPDTVTSVLDRAGWSVENLFHQRSEANLLASLGLWATDALQAPRLGGRLANYPCWPATVRLPLHPLGQVLGRLGQSGRMTIWARARQQP